MVCPSSSRRRAARPRAARESMTSGNEMIVSTMRPSDFFPLVRNGVALPSSGARHTGTASGRGRAPFRDRLASHNSNRTRRKSRLLADVEAVDQVGKLLGFRREGKTRRRVLLDHGGVLLRNVVHL